MLGACMPKAQVCMYAQGSGMHTILLFLDYSHRAGRMSTLTDLGDSVLVGQWPLPPHHQETVDASSSLLLPPPPLVFPGEQQGKGSALGYTTPPPCRRPPINRPTHAREGELGGPLCLLRCSEMHLGCPPFRQPTNRSAPYSQGSAAHSPTRWSS